MEEFIKALQTDDALAKEFLASMSKTDPEVTEALKECAQKLNVIAMKSVKSFAEEHDFKLSDSSNVKSMVSRQCRSVSKQLDKMIVDQFSRLAVKPAEEA